MDILTDTFYSECAFYKIHSCFITWYYLPGDKKYFRKLPDIEVFFCFQAAVADGNICINRIGVYTDGKKGIFQISRVKADLSVQPGHLPFSLHAHVPDNESDNRPIINRVIDLSGNPVPAKTENDG